MFAIDENDPDSTTKSKMAFTLWMFGLFISTILSLVFCSQDWNDELCLTSRYSFTLLLIPVAIALAIIHYHVLKRDDLANWIEEAEIKLEKTQ
nr:hypothetical transcript [Hymenolepis microstoma]